MGFEIRQTDKIRVEDLTTGQEVDRPDIEARFAQALGGAVEQAGGEIEWLEDNEGAEVISLDQFRQTEQDE